MTGTELYSVEGKPLKRVLGKLKVVTPEQERIAEAIVDLVRDIPVDAHVNELLEYGGFWVALDKIVQLWSKIDPDGLSKYRENIKGVNDSQWDRRYAATKDKSIKWRARMPFLLIAIIRKLFPEFSPNDEFGRRFVARYKVFRVGEKS